MHLERGGLQWEYLLEFVETARRQGIDEIGFSEHAYNFVEAAPLLQRPEYVAGRSRGYRIDDYIKLIELAKAKGLPVKLGIEMDYIPETEAEIGRFLAQYPWDYVIGAVHWIDDWVFDIDPASWDGRDVGEAYRGYFERARMAIRSGLFDILAHPDIIRIFGHTLPDNHLAHLQQYLHSLAECAAEHGVCLEVSSAGLRKPLGEIYPHRFLLERAVQLGVPISLASDAHEPGEVGYEFSQLVEYIKSVGYSTLTIFSNRQSRQEPIG